MPRFNRWAATTGNNHSWAFRAFQGQLTELNEHYWSLIGTHAFAERNHDGSKSETSDAIMLGRSKWHLEIRQRIPTETVKWSNAAKAALDTYRLHATVAMASALELYLRRSIRAALLSDPGVQYGRPQSIDGAVLLHEDDNYLRRFDDVIVACTSGSWADRAALLGAVFQSSSFSTQLALSDLQHLQDTRNAVAHIYGLSRQINEPYEVPYVRGKREVTRAKFKQYFDLINKTAKAIDRDLVHHIGEFDAICLYSRWLRTHTILGHKLPHNKLTIPTILSDLIRDASGASHGPGRPFCEALVKWVDNNCNSRKHSTASASSKGHP